LAVEKTGPWKIGMTSEMKDSDGEIGTASDDDTPSGKRGGE
jgi:hypothetical protein